MTEEEKKMISNGSNPTFPSKINNNKKVKFCDATCSPQYVENSLDREVGLKFHSCAALSPQGLHVFPWTDYQQAVKSILLRPFLG